MCRGWMALGILLAGCAAPRDAFERAERSLLTQDLPAALVAFDDVPVAHERYPEARAAALTVERRMRRGHELLLQALLLRSEWRDEEALDALRRAQVIWPGMPGVGLLIRATENRTRMLTETAVVRPDSQPPVQIPDVLAEPIPATPALETHLAPESLPEPAPEPAPAETIAVPSKRQAESGQDPVASGLVAVETRLWVGDLEAAVADLIELARRFPSDTRVRLRLSRVLHQRALQRYGHGQVAAAIIDWQRVVALDPSNAIARGLLEAASAETGSPVPDPSASGR